MSIFTGSNAAETIVPGSVTPSVVVTGLPASPSNADDIILAGGGIDTINSSGGSDSVNGGAGNDVVNLGAGNDTFFWNPGDGSDRIEGGSDFDILQFTGSGASEVIAVSAANGRTLLSRDVENVTLDLNDIERLTINTLGGGDLIVVNNLIGTEVDEVVINLAGATGGSAGDGTVDRIDVFGDNNTNIMALSFLAGAVTVTGLAADVTVSGRDATDILELNGLGGNDVLDGSAATAARNLALQLDGGAGNDQLIGGASNDILRGGSQNDDVSGNGGNDSAFLGSGDDVYHWRVGDGDDTVEGESGFDTLDLAGSSVREEFRIRANDGFLLVSDGASGSLDAHGIERLSVTTGGDEDVVQIRDTTGSGVTAIVIDLGAGDDALDAQEATVGVTASGRDGEDRMKGGGAADALDGGAANDFLKGGGGADSFVGGAGDDVIMGGTGTDTATFSGSRANYRLELVEGGIRVVDERPGEPSGTDSLVEMERLAFDDGVFAPVAPLGAVAWRHNEGSVAVGDRHIAEVSNSFQIAGTGDFDRDGDADIVWRGSSGQVVTWEMQDGNLASTLVLPQVSSGFQIAGTGDFDRDGDADILWRGNDGAVVTWQMENGNLAGTRVLPQASSSFQVAGTGDFDGDGDTDILWRGSAGQVVTWEMENGAFVTNRSLPSASTSFQIAGTGDFDADGDADILWRGSTGQVVTWEMEDGNLVTNHSLPQASASFAIVGVEDFDRDGDADILWRGDTGLVVTWEMQAGNFVRTESHGMVAIAWQVGATGGFDLA